MTKKLFVNTMGWVCQLMSSHWWKYSSRTVTLLLLMLLSALSAYTQGNAQRKISLSYTKAPITKVFEAIESKADVIVMFESTGSLKHYIVSIDVKNATVADVLNLLLKDKPFKWSAQGRRIRIENTPSSDNRLAPSQQDEAAGTTIMVTGYLTTEEGTPVPGASIRAEEGGAATVSDDKGRFELPRVAKNGVLEISSVGFNPRLIALKGADMPLKVQLERAVVQLNETKVLSTGYQEISRERAAGSFSKPDQAVFRARSSSMNVLQRLDGLIPGLTINNAPNRMRADAPAGAANTIIVRGISSISDNTNHGPLIVVDGVAMNDVNAINPQDVADITVLKDATAASIWGARASNGVIVITTKKGTRSSRLKINYDGFASFQGKPNLRNLPVLNSRQFIDAAKEIFSPELSGNDWEAVSAFSSLSNVGVPPHEQILYNQYRGLINATQAKQQLDSLAGINNVGQISDLWYRDAGLTNHTISVSGGGEKYLFYGSAAYTGTRSNTPGEKNNVFKVNVRQDFQFHPNFKVFVITDLTNTTTAGKRVPNIDSRMLPYQLFRDAAGRNLSMPWIMHLSDSTRLAYEARSRIGLNYNPLDEVNYGNNSSSALLARITTGATLKLYKGLRYEGVYGYIKGANRSTSYDSDKSFLVREELVQFTVAPTPASTPVYYLPAAGGHYSVYNTMQRNWTVRNQLVYDDHWQAYKHQLTVLAGQEATEQLLNNNSSMSRGYDPILQTTGLIDHNTLSKNGVIDPVMANNYGVSKLSATPPAAETEFLVRTTSYYANAAYTYGQKYTLNASWRIDQSNLFGKDKSAQNRPVWSIGGKWSIGKETFLEGKTWMDNLALRATYGITGNSPNPGTAASFDILSPQTNLFLQGGQGLVLSTPANAKLTWERTQTTNIGLDFSGFNQRISGSIDYYQRKTTDLIAPLKLNPFTGFPEVVGNLGDVRNDGLELSLTTNNINKKNFSWSTTLITAFNKNKITRLNNTVPMNTGDQKIAYQYLEGYSAMSVFAFDYAGLDAMGDPMIYVAGKGATKERNVSKPDDIRYMGTVQPIWSGGFNNIFSYRNFTLAANIVYNLGHVMRRDVNQEYTTGRLIQGITGGFNGAFNKGNPHAEFVDRWKKPGDEAITNIPAYVADGSEHFTRRNTAYYTAANINVVSASYIKLRDITLSYALPQPLLRMTRADNMTFRCQLSNVMLWKANKYNIDPEFQDGFGEYQSGGYRTLPFNQNAITIGIHITY